MQMLGLQKRKPEVVEPRYVGTEAFPGFKAKAAEAAVLFGDNTPHSLYDEPSIREVVLPLWNEWQRENESYRNEK